jgi:hypothetical protein
LLVKKIEVKVTASVENVNADENLILGVLVVNQLSNAVKILKHKSLKKLWRWIVSFFQLLIKARVFRKEWKTAYLKSSLRIVPYQPVVASGSCSANLPLKHIEVILNKM